jgi:hypothetical protein
MVNPVLTGRSQVFDESWLRRLGIARRDFGIGMKSPEVSELTGQIDLAASASIAARWGIARARSSVPSRARTGKVWLVKTFTGRACAMVLSGIACSTPRRT